MTINPVKLDLVIYQGATFKQDFVWACGDAKNVSSISLGPVTTITSKNHGLTTGQSITFLGLKGTSELNKNLYTVTVVDKDSFTLDGIDSSLYGIYLGSGIFVTPTDLTGYSALMHIRPEKSSSTLTLELSTANGRVSLLGSSGVIELSIAATDTSNLAQGNYVYDLELISAGSEVTRLLDGEVTVDPESTR